MKISEDTLNILKNFSTINSSMMFKQGDVISTVSPRKNILAKAQISESFERDFGIYELNRFISVLDLFEEPEVNINETSLDIVDNNGQKTRYGYADESIITKPPEKSPNFPEAEIQFKLSYDILQKVQRACGVMSLPEIAVVGDGDTIKLTALDVKNDSSDTFSMTVGETDAEFRMIFKTENLKLINGDYNVQISSKGISHFKSVDANLEYWIALESNSQYNS